MSAITYWFSLLMIFSIPFENMVNLPGVGTVSRSIGLLLIVLWLLKVLITGRFRKLHFYHLAIFLFVLWSAASLFWTANIDKTIGRIETYAQLCIFILIIWDIYATPEKIKVGLQSYILGGFVAIASTFYSYSLGNTFYSQRYAASGFNPNDLAIILALGMPVAWHLAFVDHGRPNRIIWKIVNYAYLPLATYAILLTASRAAIVGVIIALAYIFYTLTSLRPVVRILSFISLVIILFVAMRFIPQSTQDVFSIKLASMNERDVIWLEGIRIFSEHPLTGVGSNAFSSVNQVNGEVAHNIFLGAAAETGIIGLMLFMIVIAITLNQLKFLDKWEFWLWLAVLSIWMISATTHNMETRKQTWLLFTLLIASAIVAKQRISSLHEQP